MGKLLLSRSHIVTKPEKRVSRRSDRTFATAYGMQRGKLTCHAGQKDPPRSRTGVVGAVACCSVVQ